MLLETVILCFTILATAFWLFQIVFAFLQFRSEKTVQYSVSETPKISVIIPAFNESLDAVRKTVHSILAQKNVELEIIVVDDGSDSPLERFTDQVQFIRLSSNKGKRIAQLTGIKASQYDWVATVDSDTTLEPDSLYKLYCSVVNQDALAGCGTVYLSNENENTLTKTIACMYWFAFFQERASQSYFRSMLCCSGAFSVYKKNIILEHEDEYAHQTFFGIKCFAGDDRQLTNIFLLNGHRVISSSHAVAYTDSPSTVVKFLKQQIRWVRSHVAAYDYIIRNFLRWNPIFTFLSFKLIFRYSYIGFIYFATTYLCMLTGGIWPLVVTVLSVLIVTLIKITIAFLYTGRWQFFYMFLYSMFTFFVFNLIMIYAVLTPTKNSWMTRKSERIITHENKSSESI